MGSNTSSTQNLNQCEQHRELIIGICDNIKCSKKERRVCEKCRNKSGCKHSNLIDSSISLDDYQDLLNLLYGYTLTIAFQQQRDGLISNLNQQLLQSINHMMQPLIEQCENEFINKYPDPIKEYLLYGAQQVLDIAWKSNFTSTSDQGFKLISKASDQVLRNFEVVNENEYSKKIIAKIYNMISEKALYVEKKTREMQQDIQKNTFQDAGEKESFINLCTIQFELPIYESEKQIQDEEFGVCVIDNMAIDAYCIQCQKPLCQKCIKQQSQSCFENFIIPTNFKKKYQRLIKCCENFVNQRKIFQHIKKLLQEFIQDTLKQMEKSIKESLPKKYSEFKEIKLDLTYEAVQQVYDQYNKKCFKLEHLVHYQQQNVLITLVKNKNSELIVQLTKLLDELTIYSFYYKSQLKQISQYILEGFVENKTKKSVTESQNKQSEQVSQIIMVKNKLKKDLSLIPIPEEGEQKEEEEKIKRKEEEERKRKEEEKRKRDEQIKREEEEKRKREEEEERKRVEEDKRKRDEQIKREEEEKRKREEEDKRKREEEDKRKREEEEKRKREEEDKRKREEEDKRKREEEDKRKREEEDKRKREEEDKRKREEEEKRNRDESLKKSVTKYDHIQNLLNQRQQKQEPPVNIPQNPVNNIQPVGSTKLKSDIPPAQQKTLISRQDQFITSLIEFEDKIFCSYNDGQIIEFTAPNYVPDFWDIIDCGTIGALYCFKQQGSNYIVVYVNKNSEHSLFTYKLSNRICFNKVKAHENKIMAIKKLNSSCYVTLSFDSTIQIWSQSTHESTFHFKGHTTFVRDLVVVNESQFISLSLKEIIHYDHQANKIIQKAVCASPFASLQIIQHFLVVGLKEGKIELRLLKNIDQVQKSYEIFDDEIISFIQILDTYVIMSAPNLYIKVLEMNSQKITKLLKKNTGDRAEVILVIKGKIMFGDDCDLKYIEY